MKNLFAIPRRPLFVVFTILITLVVCLAGFTEAEESQRGKQKIKKQKQDFLQKRSTPEENSFQLSNLKSDRLSRNWRRESKFDPLKNSLNNFLESDGFASEKESDGYGYDDDEHYHWNYKRNDREGGGKLEKKTEKESFGKTNKNGALTENKITNKNQKGETETIEMLNFKESHRNVDNVDNVGTVKPPNSHKEPFARENPAEKITESKDSLEMRDLKGNPAIDEKGRKEESAEKASCLASETKVASAKDNPGSVKLKESKKAEEAEKKNVGLKESKVNLSIKNLKDTVKSSENKEKNIKLSGSAKLEEGGKKETDAAKITKEDKEGLSCIGKSKSEGVDRTEIIQEKTSLASGDGKSLKSNEEDERNVGYEPFVGLTDYQDLRERKENLREIRPGNVEYEPEHAQGYSKLNDYYPANYENAPYRVNDYYNKRELWNERGKSPEELPVTQEDNLQQQLLELKKLQQQIQLDQEEQANPVGRCMNFGDLDTTEYHKNYLKSLKKYKTAGEDTARGTNIDTKVKNEEKSSSNLTKFKRKATEKVKEKTPERDFQQTNFRSEENSGKKEPRNAQSKVEYEIKVINQNQQRNARLAKTNPIFDRKLKRKATLWERIAPYEESLVKRRAVPAGYYTNRVQLGQKHSEERSSAERFRLPSTGTTNDAEHLINEPNKNRLQPVWESKVPNYQHYSLKRHENGLKKEVSDNSLYLIKKSPNGLMPSLKTLSDKKKNSESNTAPYFVFEQKETFRDPSNGFRYGQARNNPFEEKQKLARSTSIKKEDKQYAYGFLDSNIRSGLKKGFEKFRDLADFFKDNEQESLESHHSAQELKEGGNVVFSDDKLPDPIVVNGDMKDDLQLKPKNSIYSISKNFKQIDHDRKNEAADDPTFSSQDYNLGNANSAVEPALKTAFPEAKSINSMQKNGNEIILLDFDGHKLNTHMPQPILRDGSSHLMIPGDRKVEVVLTTRKEEQNDPYAKQINDNNYEARQSDNNARYNIGNYLPQLALPLNMLAQQLAEGSWGSMYRNYQPVAQTDARLQQEMKNYQSQNHLPEQRNNDMKRYVQHETSPSGSLADPSTYSNADIRYLGSVLKSLAKDDKNNFNDRYRSSDNLNPALQSTMTRPNGGKQEYQLSSADERPFAFPRSSEDGFVSRILRLRRDDLRNSRKVEKSDDSTNGQTEKEDDSDRDKSEYDAHLDELFKSLKKDHITESLKESGTNRRRRSRTNRRKRSKQSSDQNKVSTTAVQNTILSKLEEDNYQSVYSSGIKRKLLSIEHVAEDCDGYFQADEEESTKPRPNFAENTDKNPIHPLVVQTFAPKSDERNRARRSLASAFHSNFKREIDLDESMPNDFQNFLETSLGGFGSQKREIIKKSGAYWDERGSYQDNANQIAESSPGGKTSSEDSPLEKREVSDSEDYKRQNYYGNDASLTNNQDRSVKKSRSQETQAKSSEYNDEKVPTKIRIQITNASSKEKKSSKSVMDERDPTSTEMDNAPPKEKEFLDKSKMSSLMSAQKLRQLSKSKFSHPEFREKENEDDILYAMRPPFRHGRRKKKKYVMEDPKKPLKDFVAFDKKTMETLLRKYLQDQVMSGNSQKLPVSNHLPQVETVYNPTQDTNKAEVEGYKLNKVNSLNSKNSVKDKTALKSNKGNDDMLQSYLREKSKSFAGGPNAGQDVRPIFRNFKFSPGGASPNPFADYASTYRCLNNFLNVQAKLPQTPFGGNSLNQPLLGVDGDNLLADNMKLQKEWEGLAKDLTVKSGVRSSVEGDGSILKEEDSEKPTNDFLTHPDWSAFDSQMHKKGFPQKYKPNDYFVSKLRKHPDKLGYNSFRNYFLKNVYDKTALNPRDASKDVEYSDDDEYLADEVNKDLALDDSDPVRNDGLRNFKTTDFDTSNEYDDDLSDDYEENSEDEDVDDYSTLNQIEPEMRNGREDEKFNDIFHPVVSSFYPQSNPFRLKDAEVPFRNVKPEDAVEPQNRHKELTEGNLAADPSLGSMNVLKTANKNANILETNLMKNLNRIGESLVEEDRRRIKNLYPNHNKRVEKRKYIRQRGEKRYPLLGNRFYAVRKERRNDGDFSPRSSKYVHHVAKSNPLDAELTPDTESEYDSEEGKHFQLGLNNFNGENKNDVEEVWESLADDVESTDNVLENVIGKYIIRKIVEPTDGRENERRHTVKKRSPDDEPYAVGIPKIVKKRLSSGHLTENNFKKFHKKNLTGKRQASDEKYTKRSPLNVWKKITNKDGRRVDEEDAKNEGFEPLVAFEEQKHYGGKVKEEESNGQKSVSYDTKGQIGLRNRNKNLEGQLKNFRASANRQEGPWKIELNEKYDIKYFQPTFERLPDAVGTNWGNENLKAYMKTDDNERNAWKSLTEAIRVGEQQKEDGDDGDDEGGRESKKIWKRSLESDAAATLTDDQSEENRISAEKDTKAVRDADNDGFVSPELKHPQKLFSNRRSVSQKSVFPPASDENILGDTKVLNEETSQQSGQQIVDAILSHASSNPEFKSLIAPGLNKRTSGFQDDVKTTRDSTDGTQKHLQEIMMDLEKLAEKNVMTRRCNKIDDKSKKFLKSLISTPARKFESGGNDLFPGCAANTYKEVFQRSKSLEPRAAVEEGDNALELCKELRRKQDFLTKALQSRNSLSDSEKENYDTMHRQILQELEDTDRILASARCKPSKPWPPYPDPPSCNVPSPQRCLPPCLPPPRPCSTRPCPCPCPYPRPCPCPRPCPNSYPSPSLYEYAGQGIGGSFPCSCPSSCPYPCPDPCPCPCPEPCPCPCPEPCPCPCPEPCPCPCPEPCPCPCPDPCPLPCPCPTPFPYSTFSKIPPCRPCKPPLFPPSCKPPRRPAFPPYTKFQSDTNPVGRNSKSLTNKQGVERLEKFFYNVPPANAKTDSQRTNEYDARSRGPTERENQRVTFFSDPRPKQGQLIGQQSRRESENCDQSRRPMENMMHFEPSKEEELRIQKEDASATTDTLPPLFERVQSVNPKSENVEGGNSATGTFDRGYMNPEQLPDTTQGPLRGRQKMVSIKKRKSAEGKENLHAADAPYPFGFSKLSELRKEEKDEPARDYIFAPSMHEKIPSALRHRTESNYMPPNMVHSPQEDNSIHRNSAGDGYLKQTNSPYLFSNGPFFSKMGKNFYSKIPSEQFQDRERFIGQYFSKKGDAMKGPEKRQNVDGSGNQQKTRRKRVLEATNRRAEERVVNRERQDEDVEEYPNADYFTWSSIPEVRRNLNNLAKNVDALNESSKRFRQADKNP